jgi:hypothetical protein
MKVSMNLLQKNPLIAGSVPDLHPVSPKINRSRPERSQHLQNSHQCPVCKAQEQPKNSPDTEGRQNTHSSAVLFGKEALF